MSSSKILITSNMQSGGIPITEAYSHTAVKACKLPLPTRIAFIGNYLAARVRHCHFYNRSMRRACDRIRRGAPVCDTGQ